MSTRPSISPPREPWLADAADVNRYAGSSYSFVGFDELVQIEESHYRRMFRVLRQPTDDPVEPAAADGPAEDEPANSGSEETKQADRPEGEKSP